MNIEAYNLDSLRKLVRNLQDENKRLKELLDKADIAYESGNLFEEKIEKNEEYDPDQGERVQRKYITKELANKYFAMFWGRTDVYAQRGTKGGYFPQCENRWNNRICPKQRGEKVNCEACEHKKWTKLEPKKIIEHLLGYREDGADVLGVYPLFPDGTCRFIVFDFDNHEKGAEKTDFANTNDEWHEEVDALRLICEKNGITPLVERSRSGRGAHIWIFFKKPISASLARNFGFLLLDKGSALINLKSFHYYDRMYPSQDVASSIGNLIALPLQGQALKNGNSAFVDKNWNAYPDQWDILLNHTEKLSKEDIEKYMTKWQEELAKEKGMLVSSVSQNRPKPWKKKEGFVKSDVVGKMHIVLGDGIYVDTLNLMPRLQNQIRSMAAFDNPVFYKNKRLGYSNYYNFSAIYMGRDTDGYICIPRGLLDNLLTLCKEADIEYELTDHREKGRPIRVSFNGDLKMQQDLEAKYLYDHLQEDADYVFILYGDNSDKENSEVRRRLKETDRKQSLILVATGQKIGEGFDYPRLDTLMLAAPVSFGGRLEQYIGRLNRDYEGKTEVIVYDYVDSHIRVFDNMYAKRLRTYKRTGFQLISNCILSKQTANAIYDSGNYMDVFERDIVEAEKKIIVSSPELTQDKTERFIYLVKSRQEAGITVTVITMEPQNISYGSPEFCQKLIQNMRESGIYVIVKEEVTEHFAIIDDELVWHGGMNLLGKEDVWDNLMRINSAQAAAELLEMVMLV